MQWFKRLMTIGRERQVQHTPARRNEWEVVVRRAALPEAPKLLALVLATFANPDGSKIHPGDELLADLCDWSQKHVREQIKVLRGYGLIECRVPAARRRAAEYQLTFPGEGTDPVAMRVGPDGNRLVERARGRGGRKPRLTGTPVPVMGADDRNSSSPHEGSDRNWSSGQEGSMTGTPVPVDSLLPELEFQMTGTGVPNDRNSSSPHHYRPLQDPPVAGSYPTPTSRADQEPPNPNPNGIDGVKPAGSPPTPEELKKAYRLALRVLNEATPADRDSALASAAARLAHTGHPKVRSQTILAAEILSELNHLSWTTDERTTP